MAIGLGLSILTAAVAFIIVSQVGETISFKTEEVIASFLIKGFAGNTGWSISKLMRLVTEGAMEMLDEKEKDANVQLPHALETISKQRATYERMPRHMVPDAFTGAGRQAPTNLMEMKRLHDQVNAQAEEQKAQGDMLKEILARLPKEES
jgi:hypothetical protein